MTQRAEQCLVSFFDILYEERNERLNDARDRLERLFRLKSENDLTLTSMANQAKPDQVDRAEIDRRIKLIGLRLAILGNEMTLRGLSLSSQDDINEDIISYLLLERCLEKMENNANLSLENALEACLIESLYSPFRANLTTFDQEEIDQLLEKLTDRFLPLVRERLNQHQEVINEIGDNLSSQISLDEGAYLHLYPKA